MNCFFTKNISPLKEMLQLVTISDYMDMYSKRQNKKMIINSFIKPKFGLTFKVNGGRIDKDVHKLKKCRITCMSTGEVYGKIENYGCVWDATGGH